MARAAEWEVPRIEPSLWEYQGLGFWLWHAFFARVRFEGIMQVLG